MKTPDFVTMEDHKFSTGIWDEKTLAKESFVRPIELTYVPKHVLEQATHKWFDKETHIYVYCRYGILYIPKKIIRTI